MPNRSWSEMLGSLIHEGRECLSVLWRLEAKLKGISMGRKVVFQGRPIIGVAKGSKVTMGDRVRVFSTLRSNPLGCFQPSVIRTLTPQAELVLGPQVGISATVICAAVSIQIGQGTIAGAGAMILDTDFHHPVETWNWGTDPARNAKPVVIGRGVFIGARAIILKGVTIGDRAVIGAGAVVTCDVPERHLACGNPAQILPLKQQPVDD